MKLFRAKLLATGSAILASVLAAGAANLSILQGSQYSEPSQILNTVNTLIQNINAGTSGLIAQTQSPVGIQPWSANTANTLGPEQALSNLTIGGGQLTANGQALRAKCAGTFGPNTNSKQVRLLFYQGATQNGALISSVASNVNGGSWELEGILSYNTATTNTFIGRGSAGNALSGTNVLLVSPIVATTAVINFANSITVQCNGINSGAAGNSPGDISSSELIVEQIK